MYRHFLIPTDGSDLAERAVTHGWSLAKFVGAKVTVIIVEERLGGWLYTSKSRNTLRACWIARPMRPSRPVCPAIRFMCKTCNPMKPSLQRPRTRGCDLIVMASHGRSGLSAMVLGSVTNKVLTYTKTPVLFVQ